MATMADHKTLADYLASVADLPKDLRTGLQSVADACREIATLVDRAPINGQLGALQQSNVQGEEQKALDVASNDVFLDLCGARSEFAALGSEEMDDHWARAGHEAGPYLLVFDPLDGSSNIEVSMAVGSIFSILPRDPARIGSAVEEAEFLQTGSNQVAAGYALYGSQTLLVLSCGAGVVGFTLDRARGEWLLTHPELKVPAKSSEYAINAAHRRHWSPGVRAFVEACEAGAEGPIGKDRNMRWTGAMVAEIHRILVRGGLFIYPSDKRPGHGSGKLRLLYECSPAGWLMAQAGGGAIGDDGPVLDITPQKLHQRTAIALGSAEEVARFESYLRG
jgi:fructose-1,6-bisphosphatase I